jgi:hypothetical protein
LALFRALDQLPFLFVLNTTLAAPPGSPANGDAYIVAASGSGAWAGKDHQLAVWTTDNPAALSGEWEFYPAHPGWQAWSVAALRFFFWNGTAWIAKQEMQTGTGAPNGAVTAPVGAVYTDLTGGASTTLYVKESGTGNTGWVAK